MDKLIDKMSEYDILNNVIPGVLFLIFIDILGIHEIDEKNILGMLFAGYFAGMVLSRLGSNIIEPFFKCCKIVEYAPYPDYLKAEDKDSKLHNLVTVNNMYRTFIALFVVLLLLHIANMIPCVCCFLHSRRAVFPFVLVLLILFILAFRKQTSYIRNRVKQANIEDNN